MLKTRAGFTLAEIMVALTLTGVIGAAVTGVFISQSEFYDRQEKTGFARGVSRGAVNMMMSELRMVEKGAGVVAATNKLLTVRAPYAWGLVCSSGGSIIMSRLPGDSVMQAEAGFSGYAYRNSVGGYTYIEGGSLPSAENNSVCTGAGVTILTGGRVRKLTPGPGITLPIATPVFMYQIVSYEFKASTSVPGRVALWRRVHARNLEEELVAPFDTTAKFRFYVNDGPTAEITVPSPLSNITGIELTLDGLSERPERDGTFQSVPLTTSVFFKNRQ